MIEKPQIQDIDYPPLVNAMDRDIGKLRAQLALMDTEIGKLRILLEASQFNNALHSALALEFEEAATKRARECDDLNQQLRISARKLSAAETALAGERERSEKLERALQRIEAWEMPETESGRIYASEFGSNGERSVICDIARCALATAPEVEPEG